MKGITIRHTIRRRLASSVGARAAHRVSHFTCAIDAEIRPCSIRTLACRHTLTRSAASSNGCRWMGWYRTVSPLAHQPGVAIHPLHAPQTLAMSSAGISISLMPSIQSQYHEADARLMAIRAMVDCGTIRESHFVSSSCTWGSGPSAIRILIRPRTEAHHEQITGRPTCEQRSRCNHFDNAHSLLRCSIISP